MFGCVVLVVDGPQTRAGAFGRVGGRRVVFFGALLGVTCARCRC